MGLCTLVSCLGFDSFSKKIQARIKLLKISVQLTDLVGSYHYTVLFNVNIPYIKLGSAVTFEHSSAILNVYAEACAF